MKRRVPLSTIASVCVSLVAVPANAASDAVSDDVIAEQRAALAAASEMGAGPQAPRDIDAADGSNLRSFGTAPDYAAMNLCNVHFHENAEHKGGEFTTFAGNGDGEGYGTGFKYDGELTEAELAPLDDVVGSSDHGDLVPGDTIEIHFVYSSADIEPGPTLGACISEAITNPDLRVEAVVAVLVNDPAAANLAEMATVVEANGFYQAAGLPNDLGTPVMYPGSTTGPSYNETASPFQVTWSVRPQVVKMDAMSVGTWLDDNPFDEDHAHGVRNLVVNPDLLAPILN